MFTVNKHIDDVIFGDVLFDHNEYASTSTKEIELELLFEQASSLAHYTAYISDDQDQNSET